MKFASFLASQARTQGDKEALVCGTQRVTFSELERQSSQVAVALHGMGVKPGDRVGLYLPNRPEFLVALLGIVKAGAITVPINMRLAKPEIRFMLEDATPSVLFLGAEHIASFDELAQGLAPIKRVVLDSADAGDVSYDAMMAGPAGPLPNVPPEVDECMISYTSGTTGKPKGAILTQANYIIMNGYLNGLYWGFNAEDRILITTPLAHRTAFARLCNMLVLGATLVILPKFDAAEVARIIDAEKISVLGIVPTVGKMLMPAIQAAPERFASLRRILATGEAFPVSLKQELQTYLPQVQLYSFYSSTEVGVVTLLGPDQQISHAASVGRVLPGIETRLVDAEGRDVATGEVGEIWVRTGEPGRYLTLKSYYNRPEANAESLIDGWFATGDMGRMDEDGFMYIVDRKKDMILSGGYNIYSKEVEGALNEHPAVDNSAVIGVPDELFGEAVAAFVILQQDASVSEKELTDWCVQRIASYKKPKYFRFVESLPYNSTGKIMKRELLASFSPQPTTTIER